MSHYYVALDREGSYERAVTSNSASSAAEEWAEWFYQDSAGEYESPFTCFVRPCNGEPEPFTITIESVPVFHASKS